IPARSNYLLENVSENIAFAEATMPIHRESRVIGCPVFQIEPAKPAIRQVQLDFLAKITLRTDAVAVRDNKHPKHEFGIDRRTSDLTIERLKLLAHTGQYSPDDRIDSA